MHGCCLLRRFQYRRPLQARLHAVERLQGLAPLDTAASTSSWADSQVSCQAAGTGADGVSLPAEYERVVAQLKKRGEKGHVILALNEVRAVPFCYM